MNKKIIETDSGWICSCGKEFLIEEYKGVPNHDPRRSAFYAAIYHDCINRCYKVLTMDML